MTINSKSDKGLQYFNMGKISKLLRKISRKLIVLQGPTKIQVKNSSRNIHKIQITQNSLLICELLETHRILRVVMFASSTGIGPVSRFPRRELS